MSGTGVGMRATTASVGRHGWLWLPALVCALGSSACALKNFPGLPTTRVDGRLSLSGPTFGDQVLAPTDCTSGDRSYFLGVDLLAPGEAPVLRLVIDPMGEALVRVSDASGRLLRLDRGDCSPLRARVEPTGWRVNEVRDFGGELELACETEAGDRLAGSVSFVHCH